MFLGQVSHDLGTEDDASILAGFQLVETHHVISYLLFLFFISWELYRLLKCRGDSLNHLSQLLRL